MLDQCFVEPRLQILVHHDLRSEKVLSGSFLCTATISPIISFPLFRLGGGPRLLSPLILLKSLRQLLRMNCYDYDKNVSKPLPHSDGRSAGDAGARWCFHWCRAAPSDRYCTWLFHWEAFQKTPTQDSHFWLVSPSRESIID